jgi:hypothetical protein
MTFITSRHTALKQRFASDLSQVIGRLLLILGIVMLIGTVCYPFGYDQAAFSVAGEMVSRLGAIPYRDFLDTKPPLIFYLYSLATLVFGHHEYSIRVLDILYQAAAAYYLHRITQRYTSKSEARIASGLYLILSSGTGFWMTSQAESFATLPSLLLLDATLRTARGRANLAMLSIAGGVALAMLFLLKFTFVALIGSTFLFLLLSRDSHRGRRVKFAIGTMLTFLAIVASYLLLLWRAGGLQQFMESLRWVAAYSSIDPLFAPVTIAQRYNEAFIARFVTTCSFTATLLATRTVIRNVLRRDETEIADGRAGRRDFYLLLTLTLFAHLLGVLIERKMFPYHYSRVFFAMAPLAAASVPAIIDLLRSLWDWAKDHSGIQRVAKLVLILVLVFAALFYSPLVKFAVQTVPWALVRASGKDAHQEVQQRTEEYFAADQAAVARYVKETVRGDIFLWGNDVGIYFFADKLPTTLCLTATPFRTAWTPIAWKTMLIKQLGRQPPELFISEFGDAKGFITGSSLDSHAALEAWPELRSFLVERYRPDTTIGHFHLYRRQQ